jgi:hypothetical protein
MPMPRLSAVVRASLVVAPLAACDALLSRPATDPAAPSTTPTAPTTPDPPTTPTTPTTPVAPPRADLRVVAVAAAGSTSYALMSDGTVRAWGKLEVVLSGDPAVTSAFTPIEVPGIAGARAIVASGNSEGCVTLDGGKVRCWAKDLSDVEEFTGASQISSAQSSWWAVVDGHLRCRGEPTCLNVPGLAELKDVTRVRRGPGHTCVLAGGAVSCWGLNEFGQAAPARLRDEDRRIAEATPVVGVAGAVDLAVASNYSCALLADRTASCWGGVPEFYVGVHFTPGKVVPLAGVAGIDEFSAGSSPHMCMIAAGRAHCLGSNTSGQVGIDPKTTSSTSSARLVEGLEGVVSLAVGASHTCAATRDGDAWCWGANSAGALGDGTMESRFTPRRVAHVTAPTLPPLAPPVEPPELAEDFSGLPEGCVNEPLKVTANGEAQPDFTVKATHANIGFDGRGDALWIHLRDRGFKPLSRSEWVMGARTGERSIELFVKRLEVKHGRASAEARMEDPEARKRTEKYLPIVTGIYRHWLWDHEGPDQKIEATAKVSLDTTGPAEEVAYDREDPETNQQVELTYLGKDWVCGKISVKDAKRGISGRFAARMSE